MVDIAEPNSRGHIKKIDNVLSLDLIKRIRNYIKTKRECRTNITSWDHNVLMFSGPILIWDLPDDLRQELIVRVKHHFVDLQDDAEWVITYTLGGRQSYISLHNDWPHLYAMTVYLNSDWNVNWGGLLIVSDDRNGSSMQAIKPSFNDGVVIRPPVFHLTTPTTIDAPMRESIQIFVNHPNEKEIMSKYEFPK